MRRFALPAGITAVVVAFMVVLIIGLSASNASGLESKINSGKEPTAPGAHLKLDTLSGGARKTLADYRGRWVMVNFFAGWCSACQVDAGDVRLAQRMLAKRGGTVLGVTFQDSDSDARSYMKKYHQSFPVLTDASGMFAKGYDIQNLIPDSFIVNPKGKIVADRTCELTSGWVVRTLNRVLGQHHSLKGLLRAGCAATGSSS